ncbi:MAG: M14 family zinc carboxypeptidase [Ornithinimicrobium sp.]|uniref:M14 family zinc carboxypeptidase n=1 Tax=Ornithinimicrobium sp. TaxID=1977084 RepID=UPI0026DF7EB7|nr:M14 family zinc carboxypeptidase [Ornithinimicrobium sp.]MDO5740764.1 M14 family zinc carboxypeptidase [Ornithinimicrobium sp.]
MESAPTQDQRARRSALLVVLAAGVAAAVALGPLVVAGAVTTSPTVSASRAAPAPEAAYPRQTLLSEPVVQTDDASLRLGLTPYHDIPRRLNAAQATSDRVSAEVIATTVTGREVVLVTLTAPESAVQASQQSRLRDQISRQPAQAAGDRGLAAKYKTSVFFNDNIHGNEWEGTDAALTLIEDYATSTDPEVVTTLETTRLYFVVTMNPDGRHDNTRRNASGFDLNRDFITATQPEVIGVRDALVRAQPQLMVDLHGYVNGTLVEPSTPPHGENYEYDLFVKHAYPNALAIESAIMALGYGEADGVQATQIPLRDWTEGWDDWPPIFTPQYAALHGAVSHTVEIPLRVNNSAYRLPTKELRRRSAINTDIARAAMTATIGYAVTHRDQLLADQIEIFRRGVAGEAPTPVEDGLFGLIGPEDVYLTDYPRAYVIPVGPAQRSAPAAARLVDHLIANGVTVTALSKAAWIGGVTYPQGSYVVDVHQAKRGMATALLGPGSDISDRVDAMYDISAWSLGLLWGADVVTVPPDQELKIVGRAVTGAASTGAVSPAATHGWVLHLLDPADVAALTALQERGVAVQQLSDGSVLVPSGAGEAAADVATMHGVELEAAPAGAHGTGLATQVVGVAGTAEERWAVKEMGLTIAPVDTAALNDGLELSDLDALYVSSGLSWRDLEPQARAELRAFIADGGGIVARGKVGAALNDALGMLELTAVSGRSDANGVAAVDSADTPIAADATATTFVYSPLWFTGLGPEVVVDQRFAADPLVSGHWRADARGQGGPASAAGQPVIVSGIDAATGARAVLIGSEPLFRAHPKGQYALVARALLWAGLDDSDRP